MTAGDGRATDTERLRAASDVEAAAAAGVLSLTEADLRLREVWHASSRGELETLRADLPPDFVAGLRRAEAAARAVDQARRELPGRVRSWLRLALLLVGVWVVTTPGGYFWPIWPLLGTASCMLGSLAAARGPRSTGAGAP